RFGYQVMDSEIAATPTGRWMFGKFGLAAGGGIPTLTTTGRLWSGAMNHLGGIFAMTASGYASRLIGFIPNQRQGFGASVFDAAVQYVQAVAGFQLANGLTSGRLQSGLGAFKMRVGNFRTLAESKSEPTSAGLDPSIPGQASAKPAKARA